MKNSRGRIGTACNECRRKKIRCDGIRPLCGNCRNKKITCVFPDRFVRASVSDEYVKFLENRTRLLEQAATERAPTIGHIPYQPPSEVGSSSAFSFMCLVEATVSQRRLEGLESSAPNGNLSGHNLLSKPDTTPPTSNDSGAISDSNASNVGFSSRADGHSISTSSVGEQTLPNPNHPDALAHVLPSREVADAILERFLTNVYGLYPIIHLPSFFAQYNAMWTEGCADDFYILLNLVFTLGSLMVEGQDSTSYYHNIAHHIEDIILKWAIYDPNANNLFSLQCLFFSSLCLLVHQKVAACCNVLALVSRYASQLHHCSYRLKTVVEKEIFNRLYYSCTIFDCVVACLFGKPLALTTIPLVPLPSLQDFEIDPALYPSKKARDATPKDLSFLQHCCVLSDISGRVVQNLYDNGSDKKARAAISEVEVIKFIIEIECELSKFDKALSSYLKDVDRNAQRDYATHKGSYVIQIRRLSLKILAYRPILLPNVSGRETMNSRLLKSMKTSISRLCIESALELIEFVWKNEDSFIMPSFWYTIFYIYNAAIVVLAALISKDVDMDMITLEAAWERALTLLQSFMKHSETAIKCLRSLQDVYAKVMASNEVMLDFFYEGF